MDAWIIDRMLPEQWERVRAIRLRALADAPGAFGTTLAEDEVSPRLKWRTRLENPQAVTFVARHGGGDVGLVNGEGGYETDLGICGLFSMWVAPALRGRGVGGALVDAVIAWARAAGYERLLLEVGDANEAAIQLYASRGFEPTGGVGNLPAPREHILEHERALWLSAT